VVASALAFADVSLAVEWGAFVGISLGAFVAMRPLARRLDQHGVSDGVGSRRLIGKIGTVLEAIEPGQLGLVRIDREEWRAEAAGRGAVPVGATVLVTQMEGTRVIVTPTKEHTQ
jgi:membrane protein implicated in regulation of membrane protease activity